MSYPPPSQTISLTTTKTRVFGLDLLRTIAIILVLYAHGALLLPEPIAHTLSKMVIIEPVTLFFVLSGFLIGQILLDTFEVGKLSYKSLFHFWLRRWMRTVPAYLATLLLLILIHKKFDIWFILRYIFFAQNFDQPHPAWFPEAWSLSIEEWFYFLIPLLLFIAISLLRQDWQKSFLITCLAIIILTPLYRWHKYQSLQFVDVNTWELLFRKQVSTRIDSIMYGVLGAYIFRFKTSIWSYNRIRWLSMGLCLFLITWVYNMTHLERTSVYSNVLAFSVESFAAMLILPFFAEIKTVSGKIAKMITWISTLSYSLYLLNLSFVLIYVCHSAPHFGLAGWSLLTYKLILYLAVTFGGAAILHVTVEHPFMVLRDRITRRRIEPQLTELI